MATDLSQLCYSSDSSSSIDPSDIIEQNIDSDLSDVSQPPTSIHDLDAEVSDLNSSESEHEYDSNRSPREKTKKAVARSVRDEISTPLVTLDTTKPLLTIRSRPIEHNDRMMLTTSSNAMPLNELSLTTGTTAASCMAKPVNEHHSSLPESSQVEVLEYKPRSVRGTGGIANPTLSKHPTKPVPLTIRSEPIEPDDKMMFTSGTTIPLSLSEPAPFIKHLAIQRLQSDQSLKSNGSPTGSLQGTPSVSNSQLYYDSDIDFAPKPLAEELEEVDNRENQLPQNGDIFAFIESGGSSSSELYTSEEESEEEYSEDSRQYLSEEINFELREGHTPSPQRVSTGQENELLSPLVAALGSTKQKKNGEIKSEKEHVELQLPSAQVKSNTEVTITPLKIDQLHSKQKALTAGESKQGIIDTSHNHQGMTPRQGISVNDSAKDHKHSLPFPHQASSGLKNTEHMKPAILHDQGLDRFKASEGSCQTQESLQPQLKVTPTVDHPQQKDDVTQPNEPSPKDKCSPKTTLTEKHQLVTKLQTKIESKAKSGQSDTQEHTKVTGRFRMQNRRLSEGQPGVKKSSSSVKRFLPPKQLNFPSVSSRIKVFQKTAGDGSALVAARNTALQENKLLNGMKAEESSESGDKMFSDRPQHQETQCVLKLEDLTHTDSELSIISAVSELTSPSIIIPPQSPAIQSNSAVEPRKDFQFEKHKSTSSEHSSMNSTVTPNNLPTITAVENSSHKEYVSKTSEPTVSPIAVSSPRFPLKGILKKKSRFSRSKSSDTDITTVTSLASDTSSNNSEDDVCQKPLVDSILKQSALSTVNTPAITQTQDNSVSVPSEQTVAKMRLSVSKNSTSSSDNDHDLDRTLTEELAAVTHNRSPTCVHNSGSQAIIPLSLTNRQSTSDDKALPQRNRDNNLRSDADKSTPQRSSSPIIDHYPLNEHSTTSSIQVPSEHSNLQLLSLDQLTHTDSEATLLSNDNETSSEEDRPDGLPNRPMLMQDNMRPKYIGNVTNKARYILTHESSGVYEICTCTCRLRNLN